MSITNAINQHEYPILTSTSNSNVPASNTNAVLTFAAGAAGVRHCIGGIAWSYSAAPTAGRLKVEDGSGNIVLDLDITAAGPGFIPFAQPLQGTAATALIITLLAGGAGVQGKVNVLNHWTETPP